MVVMNRHEYLSEEEKRLKDDKERKKYWKKWGPYTAERQWATGKSQSLLVTRALSNTVVIVREDYS